MQSVTHFHKECSGVGTENLKNGARVHIIDSSLTFSSSPKHTYLNQLHGYISRSAIGILHFNIGMLELAWKQYRSAVGILHFNISMLELAWKQYRNIWMNTLVKHHVQAPSHTKKTPLIPVKAKAPLERLQIDLVDFAKNPSEVGETTFHYVLSILDVFTKNLWLYPVEKKWCATVGKHLKAHFFNWVHQRYLIFVAIHTIKDPT